MINRSLWVQATCLLFLSIIMTACAAAPSPRELLLERLTALQQRGCMFGHQDDPFYGIGWEYEDGRSDVLETCGDWPAVMGFDLGGIENGDLKNLDSVPFETIRTEIIRHHLRGGIVTISWHPRNPLTGGTAWDAADGTVTAVLEGGEKHELFMTWLERVRLFLASLRTESGEPVPFIFRPWHENNGAWFWWGATHCTPDEFRALYILTQDYIADGQQPMANSLLWSYSPNLDGAMTEDKFLQWYPGDERIDLIGLDAYQWGTEEDYVRQTTADLTTLGAVADKHHKLFALTECGMVNNPDPTWWHRVLLPLLTAQRSNSASGLISNSTQCGLLYALVWRNYETEHFGPVPNTDNGREFMHFYNDPHTLFLNDIAPSPFVTQQGGRFFCEGKPYTFIGTNMWYGAILASQGQGGNRQRLIAELDTLQARGITNLRVLVGSDGERGVATKVEPTLQTAPGVYNDTILDGLDWLLYQMGLRHMKAVLYLNNAWEWSGGYGFYLEQAGMGHTPRPEEVGYEAYMHHVAQFSTCEKAQQLFYDYVRFIVSRTNRYTRIPYAEEPALMAWQIGNEPRAFGDAEKQPFAQWLRHTSALIRSIDTNHIISIGSEGIWGCEMDSALYRQISEDPNIGYLTVHIWPYNWGWVTKEDLSNVQPMTIAKCQSLTDEYMRPHVAIARDLRKPIVIEEFGFPRDGMSYDKNSTTEARNRYYRHIFRLVQTEPAVAGCNFWAWGGLADPQHPQWQPGDDYTGDPAQEPQGLNSVFVSDPMTIPFQTK